MRSLSVVIPAYNEEGNVKNLYYEIKEAVSTLVKNKVISRFEVIFVNDGSTDHTQEVLEKLKKAEKNKVLIIEFRKNFGQAQAFKAGFDLAKGDLIVTMDADLQNDPRDIPRLIRKLDEGYDVVSGWRYNRRDSPWKTISSRAMNNLRKIIINDDLNDYGCSLKIYKKECRKDLVLLGELHRFITAYLYIKGYKIGEIKVNHRPRTSGLTKYGFGRGLNGLFDLMFLKFWSTYASRPLHFLGRLGIYQWILAVLIAIEQIIKALITNELRFGPLLALASMLIITGLLFIMFGFLSEITSRNYFKDREIYSIKKIHR